MSSKYCLPFKGKVQSMHFGSIHIWVFLGDKKCPQVQGEPKFLSLFSDFLGFVPLSGYNISQLCSCDFIFESMMGFLVVFLSYHLSVFLSIFFYLFYMALFLFACFWFCFIFYFWDTVLNVFVVSLPFFSFAMKIRSLQKYTHQSLSWNKTFFPHEMVNNGIVDIYAWAAETLNLNTMYFKYLRPTENWEQYSFLWGMWLGQW